MVINYNLFFISCVVYPAYMASFVSFHAPRFSFFWNVTLDYSYNRQSELLIVGLMTTMLLHSLNEMHLKYVVHSKFRMIMPIS